ncbi:MAG: hypothetical protein H6819_07825 [Phycisphaerales bacterium]|nr:hypothetical protein [Phycisphaerales bacterium]MCB9854317.1 hypothetical protein [Phycisphaerales bacterium]MCB9863518.1 hypothetical protein [Phycisphaerales bacterium]
MTAPSNSRLILLTGIGLTLVLGASCKRGEISDTGEGPTKEQLVEYYSPAQIQILPFTKVRSFDDDIVPDGLAVSLRPLDGAGDPVKAYGSFLFELYAFRPATATHRGERLQSWTQTIRTPEDQRTFWERVTSTYEFQLSWEGNPLPNNQKYLLCASFEAAGAERLFDEYEFEFRLNSQGIAEDATAAAQ